MARHVTGFAGDSMEAIDARAGDRGTEPLKQQGRLGREAHMEVLTHELCS
jgi:hypothetical protein